MFIIHQSFIDLFACIFTLLSQIFYDVTIVPEKWQSLYCNLWVNAIWTWFPVIASNYNLTVMSVERCLAVTGGIKRYAEASGGVSWKRIFAVLAIVYVPAFIHVFPTVFLSRVYGGRCYPNIALTYTEYLVEFYLFMTSDLIIPGSVMFYCYLRIAMTLYKSAKAFNNPSSKGEKEIKGESEVKSSARDKAIMKAQRNVIQVSH